MNVNPAATLPEAPPARSRLSVMLAAKPEEVRAAQRLRYQVFAEEMGAKLHSPEPGLDMDSFDAYCEHLIVWDQLNQQVAASTRILTDTQAKATDGFYSQTEFDLSKILATPGRFMEIGRTCVHPDYRNGIALTLLWSGVARYMMTHQFDYLMGCASVPMGQESGMARAVYEQVKGEYLSAPHLRVIPKYPLPSVPVGALPKVVIPPLLKAYLRLGVKVCGEPCWDADFNVADVFVLLPVKQMESRYLRHFILQGAAAVFAVPDHA